MYGVSLRNLLCIPWTSANLSRVTWLSLNMSQGTCGEFEEENEEEELVIDSGQEWAVLDTPSALWSLPPEDEEWGTDRAL